MGKSSRIMWRIVSGLAVCIILIGLFVIWLFPVGLSLWTIWKAPGRAALVPVEMTDLTLWQGSGDRFEYFGYEFAVPWSDIEASQGLSPNRVGLSFHSGLQVSATALPAKEFLNTIAASWFGVSPEVFESRLGHDATRSDYEFLKRLYALTPKKVSKWSIDPSVHYRDAAFLRLKYTALLPEAADSGIFYVSNQEYKGFQQGNPNSRPNKIAVDLYADDGGIEFIFNQKDYRNPGGVSQAELNYIIQSLRKLPENPNGTR
jgi:hypothetical protein